jgi:ABC-type antimicrobial peptide transport system permease subunit
MAAFAASAGFLAAVGLYAALAFSVARRRREIGIRMALGAAGRAIAEMVLRESGRMIAIGLTAGLAAAALLTRFLSGLLFGIAPLDPAAFGAVAAALGAVGLVASVLPARRAARIDPMQALRSE